MIKQKKEKQEKEKIKNEMKETEIPINTDEDITGENPDLPPDSEDEGSQKLEIQVAQLKDTLLRKAAEFENYKRRTENERGEYFAYANEKLITELLPVLDDFTRALDAYNKSHDSESLQKGVEIVYDKFKKTLEKQGLKEMDSTGKDFDVNLHEALMQQPSNDVEPNKVIDTIEKGYSLKDKVIRHAKVIVSAKPE